MKKILGKLLFITLTAVIMILGYLIIHFYMKDKPSLSGQSSSESYSVLISSNPPSEDESGVLDDPVLSEEESRLLELRERDLGNFSNEEYSTALISMFPTNGFRSERLYYYTAYRCMIAQHPVTDLDDLEEMFWNIPGSLEMMYLIMSPDKIAADFSYDPALIKNAYQEKMTPYLTSHPDTAFLLTLPCYSLSYLQHLSAEEQSRLIDSYYEFYDIFCDLPNVKIFFWGADEWLTANPGNYDTEAAWVADVSEELSCFWFDSVGILTDNNIDERFATLRSLMRGESPNELLAEFDPVTGICDHSLDNLDIIFFGDSVIGNFKGPLSIPGAVEGLSGAHTYNLGIGGTRATMQGGAGDIHSLNAMVDAFIAKDISAATGTNAGSDFARYLEEHQKIVFRKPWSGG